jgi:hypothetical protein
MIKEIFHLLKNYAEENKNLVYLFVYCKPVFIIREVGRNA